MGDSTWGQTWGQFKFSLAFLILALGLAMPQTVAQTPSAPDRSQATTSTEAVPAVRVLGFKGRVQVQRAGETRFQNATVSMVLGVGDRLSTGDFSEATLQFADRTMGRVDELTDLIIRPAEEAGQPSGYEIEVQAGGFYLLNREQNMDQRIRTPAASGAILGTEVVFRVNGEGTTHVVMYEGQIRLENDWGQVVLGPLEESTATLGRAPSRLPLLEMIAPIQWVLYYPSVVDLDELTFPEESLAVLGDSMAAYRAGDLPAAILAVPSGWDSPDEADRIYRAALAIGAGQVERGEQLIQGTGSLPAEALRRLISAVQGQAGGVQSANGSPSLALAESYVAQSSMNLEQALEFAYKAAALSPRLGFAHARVAELEFGFGRKQEALDALEHARRLAPRHAPAITLQGFVSAAVHQYREAQEWFEAALQLSGDYGDAWLGRGLVKIRRGDLQGGRQDLQVAVSLDPTRSVLRSYLAKAFALEGDLARAESEIQRARELDFFDPTSWLYGALLKQQQSRFNEAVEDLELSKNLNDRRGVFRSSQLLDQDRAMRGANLASVYQDAGMRDWSVREAARAIQYDYSNASAHLFLANSYDNLRDVRKFNLRYETPWFSQLLLANMLAPIGAGTLSQSISLQEYSQLFERDRMGMSSFTEYFSRGNWHQRGSQFGTFGGMSYAVDVDYRSENGFAPNTDLDHLTLFAKFKQQIGEKDQLFVQAQYSRYESGDVAQYVDANQASATFRFREWQEPNLFLGWHREWSPTQRTLFLLGHLQNRLEFTDQNAGIPLVRRATADSAPTGLFLGDAPRYQIGHRSEFEAWSVEGQHVAQVGEHTWIGGVRWQTGESRRWAEQEALPNQPILGTRFSPRSQQVASDMGRLSVYAYDIWHLRPDMFVTAGLSYEWVESPLNEDLAPLTDDSIRRDRISPRLGWQWSPNNNTHVRAAWSRSLGGTFYDNSVRLEPVQIAGFTQAYRSLAPESMTGLVPGMSFETIHFGLDRKFRSRTFVGLVAEYLRSDGQQSFGAFDLAAQGRFDLANLTVSRQMNFEERTIYLNVNQLLGESWTLGAGYRYSEADLDIAYQAPYAGLDTSPNQSLQSALHRVDLWAQYAHTSGFFAQAVGRWNRQSNRGYGNLGSEGFWHVDLYAGYRWWQRRMEARVGVLNLTDRDYRLSPLNVREEFPRQRMIYGSFRLQF